MPAAFDFVRPRARGTDIGDVATGAMADTQGSTVLSTDAAHRRPIECDSNELLGSGVRFREAGRHGARRWMPFVPKRRMRNPTVRRLGHGGVRGGAELIGTAEDHTSMSAFRSVRIEHVGP